MATLVPAVVSKKRGDVFMAYQRKALTRGEARRNFNRGKKVNRMNNISGNPMRGGIRL